MANTRIKDLPDITPVDGTFVPGDSVSTATGKATIGTWVLAGIKSALAALSGAVTAAGTWAFSGDVIVSGDLATTGTGDFGGLLSTSGGLAGTGLEATGFADPTAAQSLTTRSWVDGRWEHYTPTYTRGSTGTVAQIGDVVAQRTGNLVVLHGVLTFTPAIAGTAETIAISMPTTMTPNNNFSGNGECGGASLLGLHAATDFCTNIVGVAGTKTLRWSVTTNLTPTNLHWWAQYHINN